MLRRQQVLWGTKAVQAEASSTLGAPLGRSNEAKIQASLFER